MIESASQSFGDRKVVICCDASAIAEAKTFLLGLSARVHEGFLLRDGAIVPLGWAHVVLRGRGGDLVAYEPNYGANPVHQLREDCTTTLAVHREMLAAAHTRGDAPVFPHYMDTITAPHGWLDRETVTLSRDAGGFHLTFDGADAAQNGTLRVYQLLGLRPALLPHLAIAVGATLPNLSTGGV